MLAFPFAYSQAGWVLGALITCFCGTLLAISLCVLTKAARAHDALTYQDLAFKMYGNAGKKTLLSTQILCKKSSGGGRRANGEWRLAIGDWHRITTLTFFVLPSFTSFSLPPMMLNKIPSSPGSHTSS